MVKVWYTTLAVCLVIIVVFVAKLLGTEQIASAPRVEQGVLDLKPRTLSDTAVVALNGEWLLDGERYINVPGTWDVDDHPILNVGYGTYELTLELPHDLVGETLGLYIPNAATAYELWIDEKLQLANGTVGQTSSEMVPTNYARTAYFVAQSSTLHLRIEVANFTQRKGGLWDTIYFGKADAISLQSEKNKTAQLLVVGTLLMMSIYFMLIYFVRKSQRSAFYLGLLTLIIALRTLLTGDTFFIRLYPSFPWEIQVKLEYATMIVGVPLFTRYIHHLYPEERWPKFQTGVDLISGLFLLFVVFTPALFYTQFLMFYQLIVIPLVGYFAYIFTKAMLRKGKTAYFNFICMLIFIAASLNDALFYLNMINTGQFAGSGFFIFLVSQTFVHALKYSDAFRKVENLSYQLSEANQSLESKVEERTKELQQLNARLQNVEYSRKAMFSDIAHELSGPMTLIQGYADTSCASFNSKVNITVLLPE